jgi:hypothetical protein
MADMDLRQLAAQIEALKRRCTSLEYLADTAHATVTLDTNADTLLSLTTQALGLDTQTANRVWSGPTTGAAAVPTFRALVAADLPTLTATNTAGASAPSTSTDDTYRDLDSCSVTFTPTKAGLVLIMGQITVLNAYNGVGGGNFKLVADGSDVGQVATVTIAALNYYSVVHLHALIAVTAAAHTIKIQWQEVVNGRHMTAYGRQISCLTTI